VDTAFSFSQRRLVSWVLSLAQRQAGNLAGNSRYTSKWELRFQRRVRLSISLAAQVLPRFADDGGRMSQRGSLLPLFLLTGIPDKSHNGENGLEMNGTGTARNLVEELDERNTGATVVCSMGRVGA